MPVRQVQLGYTLTGFRRKPLRDPLRPLATDGEVNVTANAVSAYMAMTSYMTAKKQRKPGIDAVSYHQGASYDVRAAFGDGHRPLENCRL